VMHGDEADGQQVRDPVLAEGQERQHHEEVEVELDVAARHMHEDRRSAHQPEADERGLHGAPRPAPARQRAEERHDHRLAEDVEAVVVLQEPRKPQLPALAEDEAGQGDHDDVEEGEPDQEAVARAPHAPGQHAAGIYGLWELASKMTKHPEPRAIAHMWPSALLEAMVREAGEAVPIGEERRALQLFNPGLEGQWATTNTMIAAIQLLLPGEVARAHRHTPTAIRFIMEGEGAYTSVDGERVYMAPGDLILTPSW